MSGLRYLALMRNFSLSILIFEERLPADAAMRQHDRQLHVHAFPTLRNRIYSQRRDGDLRGRRRVRSGQSRLWVRISVQKHPRLLSLRSHPTYTGSAAAHLADDDDDDEDRDGHDDDDAVTVDPGRSLAELSARLRVRLQRQMRGHRRVRENAESLRQVHANVHQHSGVLQVRA